MPVKMKLQGITPEMMAASVRREEERRRAGEIAARESLRREAALFSLEVSVPGLCRPWFSGRKIRYW